MTYTYYLFQSLRSYERLLSVLRFSHSSKMNFYKLLPFDIGDNETPQYTHVASMGCYEVTKVSHDQRRNRIKSVACCKNRFASSSTKLHPLDNLPTKINHASPMYTTGIKREKLVSILPPAAIIEYRSGSKFVANRP